MGDYRIVAEMDVNSNHLRFERDGYPDAKSATRALFAALGEMLTHWGDMVAADDYADDDSVTGYCATGYVLGPNSYQDTYNIEF